MSQRSNLLKKKEVRAWMRLIHINRICSFWQVSQGTNIIRASLSSQVSNLFNFKVCPSSRLQRISNLNKTTLKIYPNTKAPKPWRTASIYTNTISLSSKWTLTLVTQTKSPGRPRASSLQFKSTATQTPQAPTTLTSPSRTDQAKTDTRSPALRFLCTARQIAARSQWPAPIAKTLYRKTWTAFKSKVSTGTFELR